MREASVPVDLLNPGQVFACLGFLEAADVLLGDAEGGFEWDGEASARFLLRAAGDRDPFASVLAFLVQASVRRCAPLGYSDPPAKGKAAAQDALTRSETFPNRDGDRMALPIRLECAGQPPIELAHWADGSSRNNFKLYAGNRSAAKVATDMLSLVRELWREHQARLVAEPFDVLEPMDGSFNFDPRGAWTAIDAGYSPDQQDHGIAASPVVEILAALGLEHARPEEYETRRVRYGAWRGAVPPMLARSALAGAAVGIALRRFRFTLDLSGKNKVVTFAQEEASP